MLHPEADSLLTRKDAAAALTEAAYPVRVSTLARFASEAKGPAYCRFGGQRTLYRWSDLISWAEARTSKLG
jgi:hypothetical protein